MRQLSARGLREMYLEGGPLYRGPRNICKIKFWNGRRPLRSPRRRWVDNIRTDLQEVGCGYMDWIGLAQDRGRWRTLVSAVMNLRVP